MQGFSFRASNGNALFLILIAVALFAALAYAITQSGRGGSSSINRENNEIAAAQLNGLFSAVNTAAKRLMLIGGCTVLDIASNSGPAFDATARAKPDCDVYSPTAGGVSAKWYGTTAYSGASLSGTYRYRNTFLIDIGGGIIAPIVITGSDNGTVKTLQIAMVATRNVDGISSTAFNQFWDVGTAINKKSGFPNPFTVMDSWQTVYDDAVLLAYGDNTHGAGDWVQLTYKMQ